MEGGLASQVSVVQLAIDVRREIKATTGLCLVVVVVVIGAILCATQTRQTRRRSGASKSDICLSWWVRLCRASAARARRRPRRHGLAKNEEQT